jgi:hypothetical protein
MLRSAVNVKGGTGAEYSGAFRSAVRFQAGHWPTLFAIAMTVFLDENKAKIFCLAKSEDMRLAFLKREIKGIEGAY